VTIANGGSYDFVKLTECFVKDDLANLA
jgi:hypothetical protein